MAIEHGRRRGPRRFARAALATLGLAGVLVLVPTPRLVSAAELSVRTEHVELRDRTAARSREAVAPSQATEPDGVDARAALDAPGGRRTTSASASFDTIGVTVPVAPAEPLLVRALVQGAWTPWVPLEFLPDEGPDRGRREAVRGAHSQPVWLGAAEAYELDAPASVAAVDVHLVGAGPVQRSVTLEPATAGAAGAPAISLRSAWGARPPTAAPTLTADLKAAVVHHSVNGNTYAAGDVPAMLRSIQAYHQDVNGWSDFAYNFAVDRFGRVWEGRGGGTVQVVLGGHSQGFNTGTVGVVVLGDFTSASVSSAALEGVAQVIAWKFALHRVDPGSTVPLTSAGSAKYAAGTKVTLPRIVGHRDVQATDCPGANLYSRLGTIRTRVAQLVPGFQQGLAPELLPTDRDGDGVLEPIEYRPGASGDGQWSETSPGRLTRGAVRVSGPYRPAVGDFDGDQRTDVLWHGTGSTSDSMWWGTGTGYSSQAMAISGSYVPVVGDFDGNGVDDILWYATGTAADSVWYFQRDRSHGTTSVTQDLVSGVPLVGDFDGSGTSDVFFYGPGSADDSLWRGVGRSWTRTTPSVNGVYDPLVIDATGEGRQDILWYAPGRSSAYRWEFSAAGTFTSRSVPTPVLSGRPLAGDFDGDRRDDALVVAPGGAADQAWYSTPTGIEARSVTVGGSYGHLAGPLDHSALGSPDDVLFVSTGGSYLWRGLTTRSFSSTSVG